MSPSLKTCLNCRESFSWHKTKKFCCSKCYSQWYAKKNAIKRTPVLKKCPVCGESFSGTRKLEKYCSTPCQMKSANSKTNPNSLHTTFKRDRFLIFDRDGFQCAYCGRTSFSDGVKLHLDHIHPKSKGGSDSAGNLVTACEQCNVSKSNNPLRQGNEALVANSVREKNEHFGIPEDLLISFGKSAYGTTRESQ